ncbi:hypothetical protein ACIBF1_20255 [Spirillospora sp. NPDC050679]
MSHRPTSATGSDDQHAASAGDARSIKRHRRLRTAAIVLGATIDTAIRIVIGF